MPTQSRYRADTNEMVRVDSNTPSALQLRTRVTVAQINAGLTLLPAVPGFAYRLIDVSLIAIGGAVTGATDVRILGTRAAGSVALLVAAVAALTQSALLRAGAANAVILADGASFTPLDANTAVTIGKTGGSAATATHVDVALTYALE
jgi:hypothetical protein